MPHQDDQDHPGRVHGSDYLARSEFVSQPVRPSLLYVILRASLNPMGVHDPSQHHPVLPSEMKAERRQPELAFLLQ